MQNKTAGQTSPSEAVDAGAATSPRAPGNNLVLTVKLLAIAGALLGLLWFLDSAVG